MSGGEMGLERGLHLAHDFRLGHSTDKLVDYLTAFEEEHGGNAADAEFNGKIFALINIHLDDIGIACIFSISIAGRKSFILFAITLLLILLFLMQRYCILGK